MLYRSDMVYYLMYIMDTEGLTNNLAKYMLTFTCVWRLHSILLQIASLRVKPPVHVVLPVPTYFYIDT